MDLSTIELGDLEFSVLTAGPQDSRAAVIVLHGFPDDHTTFSSQMEAIAEAGFFVIAPRLRGYEPSSQPSDGDYSLIALAGDVTAMAAQLEAEEVHLIGHDWGAAIAYVAAASSPESFVSIATIAVPHLARIPQSVRRVPLQLVKSWYMTFFQLRWLADHVVSRNHWALLRRLWRWWSPAYEIDDDHWRELMTTFGAPGVRSAMLAYYRQNATPGILLGLRKTEAMRLTSVPVRTLAITGSDDGCIDTRMFDKGMFDDDFPAGMRVERIEGAGHFVQLEKPDRVNELLLDWIGHA